MVHPIHVDAFVEDRLSSKGTHLVRKQVDDLKAVLDDAHSHKLLTGVAAVEHKGGHEALNDGASCLAESLGLVATSGVRQVHSVVLLHCNVVQQGDIIDFDLLEGPVISNSLVCAEVIASPFETTARQRSAPMDWLFVVDVCSSFDVEAPNSPKIDTKAKVGDIYRIVPRNITGGARSKAERSMVSMK
jgi:hypothetical protein